MALQSKAVVDALLRKHGNLPLNDDKIIEISQFQAHAIVTTNNPQLDSESIEQRVNLQGKSLIATHRYAQVCGETPSIECILSILHPKHDAVGGKEAQQITTTTSTSGKRKRKEYIFFAGHRIRKTHIKWELLEQYELIDRLACSQRVPHGILKRVDDWWRITHPDTPFSGYRAPTPSIWFKQQLALVTCNVIWQPLSREGLF